MKRRRRQRRQWKIGSNIYVPPLSTFLHPPHSPPPRILRLSSIPTSQQSLPLHLSTFHLLLPAPAPPAHPHPIHGSKPPVPRIHPTTVPLFRIPKVSTISATISATTTATPIETMDQSPIHPRLIPRTHKNEPSVLQRR